MSAEKKSSRSKKELLRQVGGSSLDEIRELTSPSYLKDLVTQATAFANPSYLTQMREELAALTKPSYLGELRNQSAAFSSPSYLTQMREELAALTKPSYLDELRNQSAAFASPSYLTQMREEWAALTKPSYLDELRNQSAAFANPSYLSQMREELAALTKPSYLDELRNQSAAFANPSYLTQMREEWAALTKPSYLDELRNQSLAFANPSYLTQMRADMAAIGAGGRVQAELSAVLSSYQDLISGSALASFLVQPANDDNSPTQGTKAEGVVRAEHGAATVQNTALPDDIDLQIVQAISAGNVAELPSTATKRLQSVFLLIVAYWDMLLRIFNTVMAVIYLTALMSSATVPADVPKQAEQLSNSERQLLEDYRIVNREGANLRAEPSKKAEVIVQLSLGLPVEVLESNGKGWFLVATEYKGESVEGWIHLTVTTPVPPPKYPRGPVASATLQ